MKKLPRKLKKKLKALILKGKDPAWRSSEVKITQFARRPEYKRWDSDIRCKGITVTSYTLGL